MFLPAVQEIEANEATDGEVGCIRHPDTLTGLRCTSCGCAICVRCVVPTVVGQICPTCARAHRPVNYQVSAGALAVAVPAAGLLSFLLCTLALVIIAPLPVYAIYMLFLGGVSAARLVVRVHDRLTRAKRGTAFQVAVGIAMGMGAVPILLAGWVFVSLVDTVLVLIFAATLIISTITRLR